MARVRITPKKCNLSNEGCRNLNKIQRTAMIKIGSSPKELGDDKGSRIQGVRGSREMLKNYKELKVWQRSYSLCLEIYRIT